MDKLNKDKLDKWLITAMSHMKTMYEDNDITWSDEDEATFQQVRYQCLESQAEPSEEWIDEKARELITMVANLYPREGSPCVIPKSKAKDFIRNLQIPMTKPKVSEEEIANFHNNLMTIPDDSLNKEEAYHREIDYMYRWLVIKGMEVTK